MSNTCAIAMGASCTTRSLVTGYETEDPGGKSVSNTCTVAVGACCTTRSLATGFRGRSVPASVPHVGSGLPQMGDVSDHFIQFPLQALVICIAYRHRSEIRLPVQTPRGRGTACRPSR